MKDVNQAYFDSSKTRHSFFFQSKNRRQGMGYFPGLLSKYMIGVLAKYYKKIYKWKPFLVKKVQTGLKKK